VAIHCLPTPIIADQPANVVSVKADLNVPNSVAVADRASPVVPGEAAKAAGAITGLYGNVRVTPEDFSTVPPQQTAEAGASITRPYAAACEAIRNVSRVTCRQDANGVGIISTYDVRILDPHILEHGILP
jgi:hypothetical protein